MAKGQGVYTAAYRKMFEHPKTEAAATALEEAFPDAPWLPSLSTQIVVTSVLRLNLALLDHDSPDGVFRIPTGHRFIAKVWPEYDQAALGVPPNQVGEALLVALQEDPGDGRGGYLEPGPRPGTLQLHGYQEHNSRLLYERGRERARREPADCPRETRGMPAGNPRIARGYAEGHSQSHSHTEVGTPPVEVETLEVGKQPPPPDDAAAAAEVVVESQEGEEAGGPVPLQAIARTWREVAQQFGTRWIRHAKVPAGAVEKAVRARWKEVPDLRIWRVAMECAAREDFWAGRTPTGKCPEGWRATLESFSRDKHFDRFMALAREDWRVTFDEDRAWEDWLARHTEDADARGRLGYAGPWPDEERMNIGPYYAAVEELRGWWRQHVLGVKRSEHA